MYILSAIRMAMLAWFFSSTLLEYLFPSFYLNVASSLDSEMYFLEDAEKWITFSNPVCQSVSFYCVIEAITIESYY